MILRPFLYEPTACASYLFGCPTHRRLAVVDPHAEPVSYTHLTLPTILLV